MDSIWNSLLTGLFAAIGIIAWDIVRSVIMAKWMVRRLSEKQADECPRCGNRIVHD